MSKQYQQCLSNLTQDPSLLRSLTRGTPPPCRKLAISIGSVLGLLRKRLVRVSKRLNCSRLILRISLLLQLASQMKKLEKPAMESLLPMSVFARRKSRLITCTIKGLQTSVKSLINRSDKRMLLLTRRKPWKSYKARTLLMDELLQVRAFRRSASQIRTICQERIAAELYKINQQMQKDAPEGPTQLTAYLIRWTFGVPHGFSSRT